MNNKVIILDFGFYCHTAIFACANSTMPSNYTAFNMIIGDLKRIGVNKGDTLIVAVDFGSSWRKKVDLEYKGTRKAKREKSNINWTHEYGKMDWLLEKFEMSTPFHVVKIPTLEADDIMAFGVRFFKDKEVIMVSADSDLEMVLVYKNAKLFSPHSKSKKYKVPAKNPYKMLAKKVKKEASDDLISPVITKDDYARRLQIVNLITLPEEIEKLMIPELEKIQEKEYDLSLIPFKSLRIKFPEIYNSKNIVDSEKSLKGGKKKKKPKQVSLF